jgi:hypothetical protein
LQASNDAWASTITHQAKLVWWTHITQRATVRHKQETTYLTSNSWSYDQLSLLALVTDSHSQAYSQ